MKLNFLFSLLIAGFSCSVLFAQDDKASLEARKAEWMLYRVGERVMRDWLVLI